MRIRSRKFKSFYIHVIYMHIDMQYAVSRRLNTEIHVKKKKKKNKKTKKITSEKEIKEKSQKENI